MCTKFEPNATNPTGDIRRTYRRTDRKDNPIKQHMQLEICCSKAKTSRLIAHILDSYDSYKTDSAVKDTMANLICILAQGLRHTTAGSCNAGGPGHKKVTRGPGQEEKKNYSNMLATKLIYLPDIVFPSAFKQKMLLENQNYLYQFPVIFQNNLLKFIKLSRFCLLSDIQYQ